MSAKRKGTRAAVGGTSATKDYVVVSRLDADTHRRFKVYAETQRRSLSKQIRVLIEDAIETYEREEAA